jgi:uncharacterized protein (TIGR03086 family)
VASTLQEPIDVLSRALDQAEGLLAAVPADRLGAPTPCADWDVSTLVAHLVATPRNFLTMAQGGQPDWSAEPSLPSDWTGEFRAAADELVGTWRRADESATAESVDWQTAELAVHAWDLARATGQAVELDPECAERGLAFMGVALTAENRGAAFGAAVTVPEDAPVYDRLVALAGRDPGWTRPAG